MSDSIDQIYCTHCTYQTAFLERRGGDVADRPLGYAARASSIQPEELRKQYRNIERLLSYKLPSDAPPESKTEHNARTAPQRFFYHPSLSGNQVVGTIFYRTWDVAKKRAGAYFGHILLKKNTDPWDPLTVLKLWNSKFWVMEDDETHPHDLPAIQTLSQIEIQNDSLLTDDALQAFLTHADLAAMDSPSLPDRWRTMPLQQRQHYFSLSLRGYLQNLDGRRPGILLVAEPEIAVLLFYGIMRLLPQSMLKNLSFSTYETELADRGVQLAATTLIDPSNHDIPPDIYKRGCVINTFTGESSFVNDTTDDYTALVLKKTSGSLPDADQMTEAMASLNASNPETLHQLAVAEHVFEALSSTSKFDATTPPVRNKTQKKYIAHRLKETLSELAGRESWENDVDRLLQIINYAATSGPESLNSEKATTEEENIRELVKAIPDDQLSPFINADEIDPAYKIFKLTDYVNRLHRLPPETNYLWNDLSPSSLMHQLLEQLSAKEWEKLWDRYAKGKELAILKLFITITQTSNSTAPPTAEETKKIALLSKTIRSSLTETNLIAVLKQPAKMRSCPPAIQKAFTERINTLIKRAGSHSDNNCFEVIRICKQCDFLLDDNGKRFTRSTKQIHSTFNKIKEKAGTKKRFKKPTREEELEIANLHKALADDLIHALSPPEKEINSAQCIRLLRATLKSYGGEYAIIDPDFSTDLKTFLIHGDWPKTVQLTRLRKSGSQDKSRRKFKTPLLVSLASTAIIGFVLFCAIYFDAPLMNSLTSSNTTSTDDGSKEQALDEIVRLTQPEGDLDIDRNKRDKASPEATVVVPPPAKVPPVAPETKDTATNNHQNPEQKIIVVEDEPAVLTPTPEESESQSKTTPPSIPADPVTLIAKTGKTTQNQQARWRAKDEITRIQVPSWSLDNDPETDPNFTWRSDNGSISGNIIDSKNSNVAVAVIKYNSGAPSFPTTLDLEFPNESDDSFNSRVLSVIAFHDKKPLEAFTFLPTQFITGSDKEDGTKSKPQIKDFNQDVAIFELPVGSPQVITATIGDKYQNQMAYLIINGKPHAFLFKAVDNSDSNLTSTQLLLSDYQNYGIKSATVKFVRTDNVLTASLSFDPPIKTLLKLTDAELQKSTTDCEEKCEAAKAKLAKDLEDPKSKAFQLLKARKDGNYEELTRLLDEPNKEEPPLGESKNYADWKVWTKEINDMVKAETRENKIVEKFQEDINELEKQAALKKDQIRARNSLATQIRLPNLYGIETWPDQNATIYIPLMTDGTEPKPIEPIHAAHAPTENETPQRATGGEKNPGNHVEDGEKSQPIQNGDATPKTGEKLQLE